MRSKAILISYVKRSQCIDLRIPFCAHNVRMHATTPRSPAVVGLFICLWYALEYSVHCGATGTYSRSNPWSGKVCEIWPKDTIVPHVDVITACASPNQVLRSFPPLQASKIRAIAISFVPRLPDELYERLVHHAK